MELGYKTISPDGTNLVSPQIEIVIKFPYYTIHSLLKEVIIM